MMRRLLVLIILTAGCSSPLVPTPAPAPTIPDFQGQWTGTYRTLSCTASGTAFVAGFCATFTVNNPFTLLISQSGTAVQGTLSLGGLQSPVSGFIDTGDVLTQIGRAHV